ncbi:MAG TPA: lysophospholipid acyltransferase family protein [Candidatus Coprenecus stercoravium]|uniref:Lysophospholipid acyltransferase family protein n=1 Tax=Candidatus Coprenecus stercoravium TaxID=2840735 RepID=A0A9D2GQH6_9BACT|nr:lysophospholipid acyltransferase family protein [Candidatus Coprenecus stercoravium]
MATVNPDTKLINKSDIRKAAGLKGPFGSLAASCAMSLMGLNHINRLYPQFSAYSGREFTTEAMKTFRICADILPQELEYIPKEGPFIIVSNHPFGGWDGIVLYNTITSVRPDFKILANFILSYIPNLRDSFLAVNPFSDNKKLHSSFAGLKAAMETVRNGGCVGIFPAGEVSTRYRGHRYVADKEWSSTVMKLVRNSGVPVIPVYFDGSNSRRFHILGRIHPMLRTVNLPNELIRRSGKTVVMRIGRPVPPGEVIKSKSPDELGRALRNRVYAMEANTPEHQPKAPVASGDQEPLLPPVEADLLEREMNAMTPLFEVHKYRCYLADTEQIPAMMQEIGRSREESFRQVGEGTGRSIDTDAFDKYYKHLILWDWQERKLAGAYRLGIGRDIYEKYGVKGFYTHTLFDFSDEFIHKLPKSIELGRSFLASDYKKEALPLMLLIKGLFFTVLRYKHCKYLFGPASITSWLPPFYRSLTVYGLSLCTKNSPKDYVTPHTPFKYDFLRVDPDLLLAGRTDNVDMLDKYIQRLSDGKWRIPTLLKKYIKLNAGILAFNVDKSFNYCVDGMIFLDMAAVPREEIEMLTKGSEDREELIDRFYGTGS